MSKETTTAKATTTVTYRTNYMPINAEPRTKAFTSRSLAEIWIRNYGITVLDITEEQE